MAHLMALYYLLAQNSFHVLSYVRLAVSVPVPFGIQGTPSNIYTKFNTYT